VKKRWLALVVLVPLGGVVAVGIVRMVQHDFAVAPKTAAANETIRTIRSETREPHEADTAGRAAADQMLAIYRKTHGTPEQDEGVEQFTKLATSLELRYLAGVLEALESPHDPHEQTAPYLLPVYVRWTELDPPKAWDQVRREGSDAKKPEDRAWAVQRMEAMLAKWVHSDAGAALTAFLEAERGTESLRDEWEWRPDCEEFFTAAAEALGHEFPERLRGMLSHAVHANALNLWGTLQVRAGTDPLTVAGVLGAESIAAVTDEDAQGEFQRQAESGMFTAWLQRDASGALEWLASGNDDGTTITILEKIDRMGGNEWQLVVDRFLASRPVEVRDNWILAFLHQTGGLNLELLPLLSAPELRWKCLKQAAWPKVAQQQEGFVPWACDPAAVRKAMGLLGLDNAHRAEIERILSVR